MKSPMSCGGEGVLNCELFTVTIITSGLSGSYAPTGLFFADSQTPGSRPGLLSCAPSGAEIRKNVNGKQLLNFSKRGGLTVT